jgi:DNA-binding NtrC family response regulator
LSFYSIFRGSYIESINEIFELFPELRTIFEKRFSNRKSRWQDTIIELLKFTDEICTYEEISNKGVFITVVSKDSTELKLEWKDRNGIYEYKVNLYDKSILPPEVIFDQNEEIPDLLKDAVAYLEKKHIKNKLRETGMNKEHAANILGISLSSLYRKMDELNIESSYL